MPESNTLERHALNLRQFRLYGQYQRVIPSPAHERTPRLPGLGIGDGKKPGETRLLKGLFPDELTSAISRLRP